MARHTFVLRLFIFTGWFSLTKEIVHLAQRTLVSLASAKCAHLQVPRRFWRLWWNWNQSGEFSKSSLIKLTSARVIYIIGTESISQKFHEILTSPSPSPKSNRKGKEEFGLWAVYKILRATTSLARNGLLGQFQCQSSRPGITLAIGIEFRSIGFLSMFLCA